MNVWIPHKITSLIYRLNFDHSSLLFQDLHLDKDPKNINFLNVDYLLDLSL